MPTYEYKCDECGYKFEEFQSMTAVPLDLCPKCEGAVRRLISAGNGLIFKGSGFYITDYKNSNGSTNGSSSKEKNENNKQESSITPTSSKHEAKKE